MVGYTTPDVVHCHIQYCLGYGAKKLLISMFIMTEQAFIIFTICFLLCWNPSERVRSRPFTTSCFEILSYVFFKTIFPIQYYILHTIIHIHIFMVIVIMSFHFWDIDLLCRLFVVSMSFFFPSVFHVSVKISKPSFHIKFRKNFNFLFLISSFFLFQIPLKHFCWPHTSIAFSAFFYRISVFSLFVT